MMRFALHIVRAACPALLGVAMMAGQAFAQDQVTVTATEEAGFGRLKFDWPEDVEVKQLVTNGVLVLTFDREFQARLENLPLDMPNYVALARQDSDGKTLRVALKFPFRVQSLPAGKEVYVNLVPEAWDGELPGLPAEVLARLEEERKAREAAEAARRALAMAQLPDIPVGVGVDVSYSRILFDWPEPVNYSVSRDGDTLTLAFDKPGHLKIQQLKIDPPPFVVAARAETDENGAKLTLAIAPEAEFRIFREEGDKVVLDLTAANQDAGALATLAIERRSYAGTKPSDSADPTAPVEVLQPSPGVRMPDGSIAPPLEGTARSELADVIEQNAAEEAEAAAAETPVEAPQPEQQVAERRDPPEPPAITPGAGGDYSAELVEPGAISRPEKPRISRVRGDQPKAAESGGSFVEQVARAETGPAAEDARAEDVTAAPAEETVAEETAAAEAPAAHDAGEDHEVQHAVAEKAPACERPLNTVKLARGNTGLRFSFPCLGFAAAAVFERAEYVWVLFEADLDMELPILTGEHTPYVDALDPIRQDGLSGLRLRLSRNALVTAQAKDKGWEVAVGDSVLEPPAPLDVQRGIRADGGAKLFITTEGAGQPHRITDPEVGDELIVVPFDAPVRGVLTPRRSVDLEVLTTAHGLALQPIADDVLVKASPEEVVVTRNAGLMLTPNARRPLAAARPSRTKIDRAAFLELGNKDETGADFHKELARLNGEIAAATSESDKQQARMDLVRFYLHREMASEAMGVLRLVLQDDEEVANQAGFRALRGIAAYLLRRYELADADLSVPSLASDPNAAFWRVMARAKLGNAVEARPEIGRALTVVRDYPVDWQARFHLAAAQVALALNDVAAAEDNLVRIPQADLDEGLFAETEYYRGKVREASDDVEGALSHYSRAVSLGYRPVEAKALLAQTRLMHETGAIDDEEAINTLDRLRFTWRGDETELDTIAELAKIYEKDGNYRGALTVMRDAVTNFPLHPKGRSIAQEMGEIFRRLFLDGNADKMKPLQALSLFYDFRELTPVGRDGDAMIRNLADRLVAVDLLDQAAEMLEHQVTHRLRGVARAQVAARLAAVHLLNREPEKALTALRTTRQSKLPENVALERRLLESQALSSMGRYDHAMELIADDNAEPARALKADILWSAGKYEDAGKALENLLGLRWTRDEPLSDGERFDVLRAAIAYVLARDTEGVERVRQKFAEKMADGPQAAAFAIVASSIDGRGVEFRDLAREIAQVDMLDRFMQSYNGRYEGSRLGAEPVAEGDADQPAAEGDRAIN